MMTASTNFKIENQSQSQGVPFGRIRSGSNERNSNPVALGAYVFDYPRTSQDPRIAFARTLSREVATAIPKGNWMF